MDASRYVVLLTSLLFVDAAAQVGNFGTSTGTYKSYASSLPCRYSELPSCRLANLPFKAVMDDSHYYEASTGMETKLLCLSSSQKHVAETLYAQASYDLRAKPCGPLSSSLCMACRRKNCQITNRSLCSSRSTQPMAPSLTPSTLPITPYVTRPLPNV
jgi:hypothetical protein